MRKTIALEFTLIQVILTFVLRNIRELLQLSSVLSTSFTMKVWDRVYWYNFVEVTSQVQMLPSSSSLSWILVNLGSVWQGHETTLKLQNDCKAVMEEVSVHHNTDAIWHFWEFYDTYYTASLLFCDVRNIFFYNF